MAQPRTLVRAAAAALVLSVAGSIAAIVYFRLSAPAKLALPKPAASQHVAATPTPNDPLAAACAVPAKRSAAAAPAGLWVVQEGSEAGYRASEKWAQLPSPHEAVARTSRVSGWLSIGSSASGWNLEAGCFAMDLTTLRSIDSLPGFRVSDRDGTVQDFLDTAHFPIGRFTPSPMALPAAVAGGQVVRLSVPGAIEVKGIGRPAAAAMDVRYQGGTISAAGSTTVVTEQHGIEVPKAADFVSVDSNITVEFALTLTRT